MKDLFYWEKWCVGMEKSLRAFCLNDEEIKQLTQMQADLASFENMPIEEASKKIRGCGLYCVSIRSELWN